MHTAFFFSSLLEHNTTSIDFLCWPTFAYIISEQKNSCSLAKLKKEVSLNISSVMGEHIIFWMNSAMCPSYTQMRTGRSRLWTTGRLLISVFLGKELGSTFFLYRVCNHW